MYIFLFCFYFLLFLEHDLQLGMIDLTYSLVLPLIKSLILDLSLKLFNSLYHNLQNEDIRLF